MMTKSHPSFRNTLAVFLTADLLILSGICLSTQAQSLGIPRERGRSMLRAIKSEIKKNYYDPKYRGLDLDKLFKEADEMVKTAESQGQIFGIIALTVMNFDDSHTTFISPAWWVRVEYGWQMQMFGDECRVVAVKPGSDAEAKGVKPGDLVLQLEDIKPTRESLWKIQYLYKTLRPQPGLIAVIQKPKGEPQQLKLMAKTTSLQRVRDVNDYMKWVHDQKKSPYLFRHRYYEVTDEVLIWKMPQFDLAPEKIDEVMNKVRDKKSLILDLRGNPGGYEDALFRLIGNLFDKDVKVGDLVGREKSKPNVAKTRGDKAFRGEVVVLVDSESGSSAELLARVVQLEKRGTVIGDRSAGAVMRAMDIPLTEGLDSRWFYGLTVTINDVIMSDGKSLEKAGVIPDELLLPTSSDLAGNLDPVMARASEIVGIKLTAEKAGALFPVEWR